MSQHRAFSRGLTRNYTQTAGFYILFLILCLLLGGPKGHTLESGPSHSGAQSKDSACTPSPSLRTIFLVQQVDVLIFTIFIFLFTNFLFIPSRAQGLFTSAIHLEVDPEVAENRQCQGLNLGCLQTLRPLNICLLQVCFKEKQCLSVISF